MKSTWYKWYWDTQSGYGINVQVDIKRWRRGWVTFYRYQWNFVDYGSEMKQHFVYIIGDIGFGIQLPEWIFNLFIK